MLDGNQPSWVKPLVNASLFSQTLRRTAEGIELTVAASLFGHHLLTMKLLEGGKLSSDAHLVIAGSESARGNMPGYSKYDYDAIQSAVGGDLDAAMDAVARGEQPAVYNANRTYGNAKLWVAWWAATLAQQLPEGMIAVAVSPRKQPRYEFHP